MKSVNLFYCKCINYYHIKMIAFIFIEKQIYPVKIITINIIILLFWIYFKLSDIIITMISKQTQNKSKIMNQMEMREQGCSKLQQYIKISKWQPMSMEGMHMFKGQYETRTVSKGIMEVNQPLDNIAYFFHKILNISKYNSNVDMTEVLEVGSDYNVIRLRMKPIWPMEARETVNFNFGKMQDGKFYWISRSIDYQCPVDKNIVRAMNYMNGFIVEKIDDKRCRITSYADFDPLGLVPDLIKKNVIPSKRGEGLIQIKKFIEEMKETKQMKQSMKEMQEMKESMKQTIKDMSEMKGMLKQNVQQTKQMKEQKEMMKQNKQMNE